MSKERVTGRARAGKGSHPFISGCLNWTEVEFIQTGGRTYWRPPSSSDVLPLLEGVAELRKENTKLSDSLDLDKGFTKALREEVEESRRENDELRKENTGLRQSLDHCALVLGKRILGLDK